MNSQGYTKDNIHKGNTKIVAGGIDVDGLVRIGDQSVGGDGYVLPAVKGTEGQVLTMNSDNTTSFQDVGGTTGRIQKNLFTMIDNNDFYNFNPTQANALYQSGYGSNDLGSIDNFPVGATIHIYSRGIVQFKSGAVFGGEGVFQLEIDGGTSTAVFNSSNVRVQLSTNENRWYCLDYILQRTDVNEYTVKGIGVISTGQGNQIKMGFTDVVFTPSIPFTSLAIKSTYYKVSISGQPDEYSPIARVYIVDMILDSSLLLEAPPAPTSHLALTDLNAGDSGHPQFALLQGRSGGQILSGGITPSNFLTLKSHTAGLNNIVVKDLNTTFEKNIDMDGNEIKSVSVVDNLSSSMNVIADGTLLLKSISNTLDIDSGLIQFISSGVPQGQIDAVGGWTLTNTLNMSNNNIIGVNDVQTSQVTTNTLDSSGSIINVNKPLQVVPTNSIIDGVNNVIDFFGGNMSLTNTSPSSIIGIGSLNQIQLNASNEVKISVPSASTKLSITSSAVAIDFNANLDIQGTIIYVRPNTMPNFFIGDMTYVFVGSRNTSNSYVLPDNVKIRGMGKNNSFINYNGGGSLFSSVDNNLSVADITLTSTNNSGKLFDLSNVAQNKTIDMKNLQIRNTKNGMSIDGYDLIDLNNCIFTYFESGSPTPVGVNITNASKVQLSSCEFLRWFQEGGTPATTFFNGNMLEFGGTLNALNINGSLFHPQYDQNGIDLSAVSSAIEGTITSNTFIDINLNTPTFQVLVLNPTIAPSYVVEGNSIYPNLRAQLTYVFSGVNSSNTILSGGSNPNVVNTGGLAIALTSQFSSITAGGLATYLKKRSANFLITASANLQVIAGGSGQRVGLGLRVNGVDIPNGYSFVTLDSAGTEPKQTTLNFTGLANQNDTFELTIFNASGNNDVLVSDVNFAGIEI